MGFWPVVLIGGSVVVGFYLLLMVYFYGWIMPHRKVLESESVGTVVIAIVLTLGILVCTALLGWLPVASPRLLPFTP